MSTKQTEALKLALLALEECRRDPRLKYEHPYYDKAITAIREALAEQPAQQEPVDVVWFEDNNGASRKSPKDCQSFGANGVPAAVWVNGVRYTSPQPSKPWVGLTDEERDAILNREFKQWWSRHDAVCRAIEAKLREKNT